ncbi:MAG: type II secretion system protein [Planctomycetes bacterium]|nr:type II secretion system protein [Planctomycetota bacterium]
MKPNDVRARGVTLVELLVVISIIAFLAGALVVASQKIRSQAQRHSTAALIEKICSANEQFYNEWRFYAPDTGSLGPHGNGQYAGTFWNYKASPGIPLTLEEREVDVEAPGMPGNKMPTSGNEYLMINLCFRGQFIVIPRENLAGPERKIDLKGLGVKKMDQVSSRCIIVDSWGRPLFYDCHKPEGKDYTNGLIHRNVNSFDLFSLGPDGRTSSTSNNLDDDGDGTVDESDEGKKLGESADDLNNWRGVDRR